jgi:hypothetical protein
MTGVRYDEKEVLVEIETRREKFRVWGDSGYGW